MFGILQRIGMWPTKLRADQFQKINLRNDLPDLLPLVPFLQQLLAVPLERILYIVQTFHILRI